MPNFVRIAAQLNRKLDKNQPMHIGALSMDKLKAMHELEKKLVAPQILALPYAGGRYTIDTDTCSVQAGCAVLQKQPGGTTKSDDYWSRSMTTDEQADDTTQHECLEIVWTLLMLCCNLESTRFKIQTDHKSLNWILNLADVTGRTVVPAPFQSRIQCSALCWYSTSSRQCPIRI